ncbi:uncharacterized protein LOC128559457 [Mercenaria mercenaria]|uniref:uncharacterized protein LOC128559457 n=1 Tax=Mercenaria mercenaria TaxID=6596 RepID=UPI00234E4805|nr:uncharacterized protein LOC128559457 [Mercenaria mercenaria]
MQKLYRVLKPLEDWSNGIQADNPNAVYTVMEHVSKGYLQTQFISTSKSYVLVKDFAGKGRPNGAAGTKKIVEIDVEILLQHVPNCIYIDLTDAAVLDVHIPNLLDEPHNRVRRFAKAFEEVLLKPVIKQQPIPDFNTGQLIQQPDLPFKIPPQCIKEIDCV